MKFFPDGEAPRRVLALAFCAALVFPGCGNKNSYKAPPPAKVTVATPTQMAVTLYADFTGNTAAVASVDLEARVQGFLKSINYRDGEPVKAGSVLFEIEKDQYQAQVDLQNAQLAGAKAKQANAQREYERQVFLGQKDVSSQRTVEDAKTALDSANAVVAEGEANLKLAQTSLGYATVRAPFDGVVTRHLVDVGALVGSSGPTKLATILQIAPIYVYFNISEQQQADLRSTLAAGRKTLDSLATDSQDFPVEVALGGDTMFRYKGRIDYIAPHVDSSTGTLQLRATLPNTEATLLPGVFVRIRLPIGRIDPALLVNDTAVMSNQIGSYVMVVGKDNVVEQRQVTTGPVEGQLRVITSGLSADDRVAVGSIQRAVAGSTVDPVAGAMAEAPQGAKPAPAALKADGSSEKASP